MHHAAGKPVAIGLLVMPDLEGGIERDQSEPPPELRRRQQRRLAGPDHRNRQRRAQFVQSGILEVAHDVGVKTILLRSEAIVDRLHRATKFAQAAEIAVGGRDAFDMDAGAGRRDLVQIGGKLRHVGCAGGLVDEALPEDAHSNILFHRRTAPGLAPRSHGG